jgi:FkbM family methyltransferase
MGDQLHSFELNYYDKIKEECEVIFDVGAGWNSLFINDDKVIVHYFEPFSKAFNGLKNWGILNKKYFLNNFGLSDEKKIHKYYEEGSLYDRNISNNILEECEVKTGLEYCLENKVDKIDFLKIDVEGFETKVLLGFGDFLKNIRYIQFEYGVGLKDAGSNLNEIIGILKKYGFHDFYKNGIHKIESTDDFWEWCNINCENINFKDK